MANSKDTDISALLLACRDRDDDSFAELVRLYTPMMHSVIGGFGETAVSADELFAEACVALHSAVMRYDIEQNDVTFGLYARICVHNRLLDALRKAKKRETVSEYDVEDIADSTDINSGLVLRETVETMLSYAESALSEYEYRVLVLHIQGYKTAAIAKALSRTPKSVDNAKFRIFRRMRETFADITGD
jgi:RNA polymerase sporulation-specific sigma factor